jgi:hypothetical protein
MFAPEAVSLPRNREEGSCREPHLESGVMWGTVLLVAGALVVLNALGLEIGLSPFFGILLLVAGALVLFRCLGWRWLPGPVDRGEGK